MRALEAFAHEIAIGAYRSSAERRAAALAALEAHRAEPAAVPHQPAGPRFIVDHQLEHPEPCMEAAR